MYDGKVKCWGWGSYGQVGDSVSQSNPWPVHVRSMGGVHLDQVEQLTAGNNHTCAIRQGGEVVCWGSNTNGQLGIGTTTSTPSPATVLNLSDGVLVSAGANHTCVIRQSDEVACWGGNIEGQLGDSSNTDSSQLVSVTTPSDCYDISSLVCNGACVLTDTDTSNCGSCSNVCGGGQSCSGGTCQ